MPRRKKEVLTGLNPDVPEDMEEMEGMEGREEPAGMEEPAAAPPSTKMRFVSNHYPNLSICVGKQLVQFKGDLVTDDPEVIAAVEGHPWFGLFIHRG
jgi:hypothetical protein